MRSATTSTCLMSEQVHNNGMTLRDYFAAKIVQVSLAGDIEGNIKSEIHASWSYKMADAMLKARTE